MPVHFHAELDGTQELLTKIVRLAPTNPFYTLAYIEARRRLGFLPWVLWLEQGGVPTVGCTAFLKSGRLNRILEITSVPELRGAIVFWDELLHFCRQRGVTQLQVNSFGSTISDIPCLVGELARRTRWEYVLELQRPDLLTKMRKGHVWCIKRGRKFGLTMRRTNDSHTCLQHAEMLSSSMRRRKQRGENVSDEVDSNLFQILMESGAGTIFQALLDGRVLSSNLVLLSEQGAYNYSQGTSSEGMNTGAAHFLISEIAAALKHDGVGVFNLGGAEHENSGLEAFKSGFGARTVELVSADFWLGGTVKRGLSEAVEFVRDLVR